MATPINLELIHIDRALEASTKLVGEWIDDINDTNRGNMRRIQDAFGELVDVVSDLETEIEDKGTDLQEHIDTTVNDTEGAHGIRVYNGNIEVFDGTTWVAMSFDLSALQPDTFVISMPMTTETYYTTWQLHKAVGGIHSPLDGWGFTNAVLTGIPMKPVMDFNTNQISIYSTSEFEGYTWTFEELQDGVFIISATATDVALILVRR